jgi:hypothetical protein
LPSPPPPHRHPCRASLPSSLRMNHPCSRRHH